MIAIPNMEKPKSCKECESFYIEFYMGENKMGSACTLNDDDGSTIEADYNSCPLIDIVTCGECKHKPIKYDPEGDDFGFNLVSPNGYDNLCPYLNTDDGFYSYMPEDNFFCAFGERRAE